MSLMRRISPPGRWSKWLVTYQILPSTRGEKFTASKSGRNTNYQSNPPNYLPLSGLVLFLERLHARRRRDAIQEHVNQSGQPTRDFGPGSTRKAFPLHSPWLVDVHVSVHETFCYTVR